MKTERLTISNNDKIALISNLATMLSAGIPILEAIESLLDGAKGSPKKILETLKDDLVQGQRIYVTLGKFPRAFDKVTVNIIRASEEAGTLNITLKDLVAIIKRDMEFSDKIRSSMIYPVFILVVFILVFIMILTFVVPKIATVFSRLSVDLPLPTRVLMFLSDALLKYWIPLSIAVVVLGIATIYLYKNYKRTVLNIMFSLPYISQLAREIDLTRFSRSLFLLLNAGIPITNALEMSGEVVTKKEIAAAIAHTKEMVIAGKKVSEGLKEYKHLMPNVMIKIVEAGEKSGSLDKSMQDASEFMDYQVTNTLKLVTALMEPLMLVFVAGMIGGMMLSIIAPIYGIISQVGGR